MQRLITDECSMLMISEITQYFLKAVDQTIIMVISICNQLQIIAFSITPFRNVQWKHFFKSKYVNPNTEDKRDI